MLEQLEKAVHSSSSDFIEVRALRGTSTRIKTRNQELETADFGVSTSLGVRVLDDKSWGFAASHNLDRLMDCVESAEKLARTSSRKGVEAELAESEVVKASPRLRVEEDPREVDLEEKASRCLDLSEQGFNQPSIRTVDLRYLDSSSDWFYLNSEGTRISYNPVSTFMAFTVYVREGQLMSLSSEDGGRKGFELMRGKEELVNEVCSDARTLLKARKPPTGKQPVVVDQKMAGTLAHEAIGHALEGDNIINHNSTVTKKNQLVGSSQVSIVDDPTIPGLFGSYPFDSEGVKARKTLLVKKGRVKSFLHSRETAFKEDDEVTGNARAGATHFPLVRMSNTFFQAGEQSLEEVLEGIEKGVYVKGFSGGVSDTDTGFFQFASPHGNLIEEGEITRPLKNITLVGNITDTLKGVGAASQDLKKGFPGMCGKAGQMMSVTSGGPHLRLKEVLVG